jgi:hypothetical protein
MKAHLLAASLFLSFFSFGATAGTSKSCPLVDCDCGAIADAHWRNLCETREAKVIEGCLENQGLPKSFCGLHGPQGFPVATSLQPDKRSLIVENEDIAVTAKLISTQNWSLDDSFAVLKTRERAKQFGDAVQLAGLLERDIERLYQLQRQADAGYKKLGQEKERVQALAAYVQSVEQRAQALRSYSGQLWQQADASDVERERKAYRMLAFKIARLAGTVYEYTADLSGLAGDTVAAASAWQSAAELAQSLERWERSSENKAQHLTFYQAQAAARWHRATYELLQAGQAEAMAATLRNAQSVDRYADRVADNGGHSDHEMAEDTRAIKRGSR